MTAGVRLLAAHSLGTDRTIWEPLRAALGDEVQLEAVDLPGHGAAPGPFTMAAAADAWRRALEDRGEGTVSLGLGLGALVVASGSSGRPAILVSPYVRVPGRGRHRVAATTARIGEIGYPAFVDEYLAATVHPGSPEEVTACAREAMLRTGAPAFLEALDAAMAFEGGEVYPELRGVAVVRGVADSRVGFADAEAVAALAGAGAVNPIADAGHFAPLEQPEAVAAVIRGVLGSAPRG